MTDESTTDFESRTGSAWIRILLARPELQRLDLLFWRRLGEIYAKRDRLPMLVAFSDCRGEPPRRVPLSWCMPARNEVDEDRFPPAAVSMLPGLFVQALAEGGHETDLDLRDIQLQLVGPRKETGPAKGPLKKTACAFADGIAVDVDLKKNAQDLVDYESLLPRDIALRLAEAGIPQPTAIVATGGGYHVVWLFTQRLWLPKNRAGREWRDLEGFHKRVLTALDADRAGAWWGRPFRLPGSWNPKRRCTAHVVRLGDPIDRATFLDVARSVTVEGTARALDAPASSLPEDLKDREWANNPLFYAYARGKLKEGCRNTGIFVAAVAAWYAGAPEDELRRFVRWIAEQRCEGEPQPWRMVVKSVLARAREGNPYHIPLRMASNVTLIDRRGRTIRLHWYLPAYLAKVRVKKTDRCNRSNFEVLVRLLAFASQVVAGDSDFEVVGRYARAPSAIWADRIGVYQRSISYLRKRVRRTFPDLDMFHGERHQGLIIDRNVALDPKTWTRREKALREFADTSISYRRTMWLLDEMTDAAHECAAIDDPEEARRRFAEELIRIVVTLDDPENPLFNTRASTNLSSKTGAQTRRERGRRESAARTAAPARGAPMPPPAAPGGGTHRSNGRSRPHSRSKSRRRSPSATDSTAESRPSCVRAHPPPPPRFVSHRSHVIPRIDAIAVLRAIARRGVPRRIHGPPSRPVGPHPDSPGAIDD